MPKVVPRPLPVGSSPGRAPPVRPAPSAAGPPLPVGSPQGRPPRIRPTPSASSSYARASTHRGCRLQLAPLWVRLDARRHCRNHGFPSCRRRSRRRVHAGVRREVCGTGRRCKVGRVRKGRVLEPRRLCQESRACNNPRCHRTQQQCRPLVRRCSHEIARGTRAEEVSRYSGSISPLPHWQGFFLCIYLHKQLVANSRDFAHQEKRSSSLLKNLESGAFSVFLPGLRVGAVGVCSLAGNSFSRCERTRATPPAVWEFGSDCKRSD